MNPTVSKGRGVALRPSDVWTNLSGGRRDETGQHLSIFTTVVGGLAPQGRKNVIEF